MGTEESIIYSYDLATVPSVLPAFANAKDLIVCDEARAHTCMHMHAPPRPLHAHLVVHACSLIEKGPFVLFRVQLTKIQPFSFSV